MQLRESIANPDRFDEAVFRSKQKDLTRPLYPKLLAEQVIHFNPNNQPAAFPSLSLHARFTITQHSTPPASHLEGDEDTGRDASTHEAASRDATAASTNTMTMAKSRAHNICETCHLKIRTEWRSLPLSVQAHIFNSYLVRQKYPEAVACTLQLTHEELETIRHQLNLRKIYQAPLDDIWSYAAAQSGLGSNVIDPEKIDDVMDYMLFASHYEDAAVAEVELGKTFLKQRGLDIKIMSSFGSQDRLKVSDLDMAAAQNPAHSPMKRRRTSSVKIMINAARADPKGGHMSLQVSGPTNVAFFKHQTEQLQYATKAENIDPSLMDETTSLASIVPHSEPNETIQRLKRMRLNIDDSGHASVYTDHHFKHMTTRTAKYDVTDRSTIAALMSNHLSDTVPETHHNHNSKAFAAHFGHITFPPYQRRQLLRQDPQIMSIVDHWLIYGTAWIFQYHRVAFGPVPQPSHPTYDPRGTILKSDQSQSLVLAELVNLHNAWVLQHKWDNGDSMSLVREFDLIAETVMEKALAIQIPSQAYTRSTHSMNPTRDQVPKALHSADRTGVLPFIDHTTEGEFSNHNHTLNLRTKSDNAIISASSVMARPRKTKQLVQNTLPVRPTSPSASTNVKPHQEPTNKTRNRAQGSDHNDNTLVRSALSFVPTSNQRTPSDRATQQHTGDTTIDVLGDTDTSGHLAQHLIEPGSTRRQLFDSNVAQSINEQQANAFPEKSTLRTPSSTVQVESFVSQTNDIEHSHIKSPSYSPLSDQDPESIPAWARYIPKARKMVSDVSSVSHTNPYRLPPNRPVGASLHGNPFLQGIIDAAGHEVLHNVGTSTARLDSTKRQSSSNKSQPELLDHGTTEKIPSHTRLTLTPSSPQNTSTTKSKAQTKRANHGNRAKILKSATTTPASEPQPQPHPPQLHFLPAPTTTQHANPQLLKSRTYATRPSTNIPLTTVITPVSTESRPAAPGTPSTSRPATQGRRSDYGRKRGPYKKKNAKAKGVSGAA